MVTRLTKKSLDYEAKHAARNAKRQPKSPQSRGPKGNLEDYRHSFLEISEVHYIRWEH